VFFTDKRTVHVDRVFHVYGFSKTTFTAMLLNTLARNLECHFRLDKRVGEEHQLWQHCPLSLFFTNKHIARVDRGVPQICGFSKTTFTTMLLNTLARNLECHFRLDMSW
jgi:hypothetical protein